MKRSCNTRYNPWTGVALFLEASSHDLLNLYNPFKDHCDDYDDGFPDDDKDDDDVHSEK